MPRPAWSRLVVPLALLTGSLALAATPDVYIAYPPDKHVVRVDHVLLEGSVAPGADLRLDGKPVKVGPDGLFIEWWPLRPGTNALKFESRLAGQRVTKTLQVTSDIPAAAPLRIVANSVSPQGTLRLFDVPADVAGRSLPVSVRGTRAVQVTARLGSLPAIRLTELSAQPGTYVGTIVLPVGATLTDAPVTFTFRDQKGATVSAPGVRVSTSTGRARVGTVVAEDLGESVNPLTTAGINLHDDDPVFFPRQGTRVRVTGEDDRFYRVTLAPGIHARIERKHVQLDPEGTPVPQAALATVALLDEPDRTEVRLTLDERVPFVVETGPDGSPTLDLRLFHTRAPALVLPPAEASEVVRQTTVVTASPDETRLRIDLAGRQPWGWRATWEGTELVLRLTPPPRISVERPLQGRRVVLDAGHGGTEKGGAGPLRVPEKDLMLPITLDVARRLRELGATVILTRETDTTVPLYDRPLLAEAMNADVLVSLHGNAIPDGVDPRTRRGAGVYYFQNQALPLARDLLAALLTEVPEVGRDREGLFRRSFALARPGAQPSVLVEFAYLTDAGNLRLLMSPESQARFAAAITRGLEAFFRRQADVIAGK